MELPSPQLLETAEWEAEKLGISKLAAQAGEVLSERMPSAAKAVADTANSGLNWLKKAESIANPYLDAVLETQRDSAYQNSLKIARGDLETSSAVYSFAYKTQMERRYALTNKYSWAIPNAAALSTIAEQGDIVEAGAGSGYWSGLLRKMDVDVVAFDQHGTDLASNHFHKKGVQAWTEIIKGDAQTVSAYGNRTLFMSFPPADDPFAHDVLKAYTGKKFVYIGEDRHGVTGDASFFDLLDKNWEQTKYVTIPNWHTSTGPMQDYLQVFKRKS